jgi:hypothetical protein
MYDSRRCLLYIAAQRLESIQIIYPSEFTGERMFMETISILLVCIKPYDVTKANREQLHSELILPFFPLIFLAGVGLGSR